MISLDNLARAGDDPRARWGEARAILVKLKSENSLTPTQEGWIGLIDNSLAKFQQVSSFRSPQDSFFSSPITEQIQGTYLGTNAQTVVNAGTEMVGKDQILLTFKQSGSEVTASYQTSLGGQGKGTGTISGNVVSAISFQSEVEACPGSFTASLTFSGDTVTWRYAGEDCGGPVHGHGQAKKTKVEADALK